MPTYEYQCEECAIVFDRFQSMSEEPVRACPKCGGRVQRLMGTGAGVIFKGRGFHATDYPIPLAGLSVVPAKFGGDVAVMGALALVRQMYGCGGRDSSVVFVGPAA